MIVLYLYDKSMIFFDKTPLFVGRSIRNVVLHVKNILTINGEFYFKSGRRHMTLFQMLSFVFFQIPLNIVTNFFSGLIDAEVPLAENVGVKIKKQMH